MIRTEHPQRVGTPLVRWYSRRQLPWFHMLLDAWGVNDQSRWQAAPMAECRERCFGHRMRLDLSDFYQRLAFYYGCYHELHVLGALDVLLREGEALVDAGANIGLVTMHGAGLVGGSGRVDAFEPYGPVYDILEMHCALNGLDQVHLHRLALSDRRLRTLVRLPDHANTGSATCGPIPARYRVEPRTSTAEAAPLDEVLEDDDRPLVVKLDVEGFEHRVLSGMGRTLTRRRPAIILEVNDEMLSMNRTSASAITAHLDSLGYVAHRIHRGFWREANRMRFERLEIVDDEPDALFVHPSSAHWDRLSGRGARHLA